MKKSLPNHIAYFISGHGYGHAVRSAQLINALPNIEFSIFTTIEKSYFNRELTRPFEYHYCKLDCGCIQSDALETDIESTYEQYLSIENQREKLIAECKQILLSKKMDFVVSDITPLAFTIARQLNLPSLAISNFTWVEIYEEYIPYEPRFEQLIAAIRRDYANASYFARLRPGQEQHPFQFVEDVGLLCRNEARNKNWLFERLSLDPDKYLCLVYIGIYGLRETNWQKFSNYKDWQFIGIYPLSGAPGNYLHVNLDESPVKYTDLVANCDLILAKLGYGIVSESLFWKKPVTYPPRRLFSEFYTLERELLNAGTCFPLSVEQLQQCELDDALKWATNIDLNHLKYDSAQNAVINIIQQMQEQYYVKEQEPTA